MRLLKFDLSLVTLQALKNFPGKIEKSKILQIELVLIRLNFSVLFQKSSREFEWASVFFLTVFMFSCFPETDRHTTSVSMFQATVVRCRYVKVQLFLHKEAFQNSALNLNDPVYGFFSTEPLKCRISTVSFEGNATVARACGLKLLCRYVG